jgi:hypothetical protein
MPWTIPDKGEGQNDLQSVCFQEYLEVLLAGINGIDCVLSGGAVTAQGSPDMTVAVAKAAVLSNRVLKAVAAANANIAAADGANPRLDLVVINSSGAIAVRTGTAAAAPKPPARSANDVVLAVVYVPASDTTIASDQISDLRVVRAHGPIRIATVTSPVTFNTTNAIQTYLSVVIPSGLLLAARGLLVRCGGTILTNGSSSPTMTPTLAYGGTTLWSDTSGGFGQQATRRAWWIEFDLIAQADNDQVLVGVLSNSSAAAAATTGIGAFDQVGNHFPIKGDAAVDSDAGDRSLTLQWTMSVSHASIEIVMEYATVDLL